MPDSVLVMHALTVRILFLSGLTQDGCRADASAVLFTSVKSACAAVATLHQTDIKGNYIWARQLGGEVNIICFSPVISIEKLTDKH